MKKFFALMLTVLMVMSMAFTALADDPVADPTQDPVELDDPTTDLKDHTFKAYQIFKGSQAEDDSTLGDIVWGEDIDSAAFVAALMADDMLKTYFPAKSDGKAYTAAEIADVISTWADGSQAAFQFAKLAAQNLKSDATGANPGETLDAGYYVVVDTTAEGEDIYNVALLQLTKKKTFDVVSKVSVPEVEKTINNGLNCTLLDEEIPDPNDPEKTIVNKDYDKDHVHTAECYNLAKSDKKPIGGVEDFRIDTAVPLAAATYDYYYFIVKDTLSKGLTYNENSLKVYIDGVEAASKDYTTKIAAVVDKDGQPTGEYSIQVALVDAIANAGKSVTITYTATVNKDAIIGTTGNPNEVTVDYSSKPDFDYDGTKDQDYPGFPDTTKTVPMGTTPKTLTLTFVTEIAVYKVDEKLTPLSGAEFTLEGEGLNVVLTYKEVFEEDEDGEYWKLAKTTVDGKPMYTKEEPVTVAYVEDAEADATKGYVLYTEGDDVKAEDIVEVENIKYRPYVPAKDDGMKLFVIHLVNTDEYATPITTKYKMTKTLEATKTASEKKVTAAVDDNGYVSFSGLDAGKYTISETTTPAGYNTIDPIEFTIDCELPTTVTTGKETCTWSVKSDSIITYNEEANAFEITIVNEKGNVLPETGGIGTTIFYAVGGVLVVGAAILLITKKRMSAKD